MFDRILNTLWEYISILYLFCEHFEFRIPNLSETLFYRYPEAYIRFYQTETTLQLSSQEKVFWKYAANLQENIHDKVWFQ